jgi:hypothetical protein
MLTTGIKEIALMGEYSDYLILAVIVIAFIAGYSIISFLIRFAKKSFNSLQLPPTVNNENKPSNEEKKGH